MAAPRSTKGQITLIPSKCYSLESGDRKADVH